MKTSGLDRALLTLNSRLMPGASLSHIGDIDARAVLTVTILYLVLMLSVPVHNLEKTIWFAVYPIITAPLAHIRYSRIFIGSLYILPFVALIGAFNPFFDRHTAFVVAGVAVSDGWLSFINIMARGLLAFQALLLLIHIEGFTNICAALQKIGMPSVLSVQLLLLYRYLGVVLEEAIKMRNARTARGYGRSTFPLGMWARIIGALLVRSMERGRRIGRAMDSRGFHRTLHPVESDKWKSADTLYCFIWISVLSVIRFTDMSALLLQLSGYNI